MEDLTKDLTNDMDNNAEEQEKFDYDYTLRRGDIAVEQTDESFKFARITAGPSGTWTKDNKIFGSASARTEGGSSYVNSRFCKHLPKSKVMVDGVELEVRRCYWDKDKSLNMIETTCDKHVPIDTKQDTITSGLYFGVESENAPFLPLAKMDFTTGTFTKLANGKVRPISLMRNMRIVDGTYNVNDIADLLLVNGEKLLLEMKREFIRKHDIVGSVENDAWAMIVTGMDGHKLTCINDDDKEIELSRFDVSYVMRARLVEG